MSGITHGSLCETSVPQRRSLQEEPRLLKLAIDNMPKLPVEDIDVLVRPPHAREPYRPKRSAHAPARTHTRADALVRGSKLAAAQPRAGGGPQQMAAGAAAAQLWGGGTSSADALGSWMRAVKMDGWMDR